MKRMKSFDFEVITILGPPLYSCKIILPHDEITIYGNSIAEIFFTCQQQFPTGLYVNKIIFSGKTLIDAKKNLSEFLNLGFQFGYFGSNPEEMSDGTSD